MLGTLLILPAYAQQRGSAGIYGRITDNQQAVIPGVRITLVQTATNQERIAISNQDGQYQFPLLPVGEYRLYVQHPGFRRYEERNIILQVNDNRRIDVELAIGDVATAITVEAGGVTVETSNATIRDTVDSRRVVDLPLNGRNLADLTLLVPGVTPGVASNANSSVNGDVKNSAYSGPGSKEFSVNGSRQNNLKFTLDGGDNQDNLFNSNLAFPFPDAVQEFSVQTANSGVEIGKSSGGTVNMVTKSGTNNIHGDVFWFVRNTEFNANGYFSRSPDRLKRNQTGFTLGGPVVKDKFFLFGGYQRTWVRSASGSGQALTMPQPFRSGDFSSLLTAAKPVVITDPLSHTPFPNNMIPQSRLSPAAQGLLQFSPLPGPDGLTHYALVSPEDTGEYIFRGDYRPSASHSIMARYYHQQYDNPRRLVPNNIHSNQRGLSANPQNATLGYTWIANPSLVSDSRITMGRQVGQRTNDFPKTIRDFGVNVSPASNEIDVQINGTSGINLSTVRPAVFARTNIEFTHSWRWIHGRHNFIWGTDLEWSRYNEYNVYNGSGVYRFDGRVTGFDQADYVLGYLASFRQSNGEIEFRRFHYQGFYFGDTFRVHPRLTLNFGLRWEPYTPITDLLDREVQFNQTEYQKGTRSQKFVNAPPGLLFPGDKASNFTVPKAGTDSDLNNLGPRFGFAWDINGNGKTSLRGGYGIFYDTPELWLLNNMNTQTPFSFTVSFNGPVNPGGVLPFDNPYLGRESFNVFPYAGDFDPKTPFQIPFETTSLEKKFVQAYVQNFNLTIERRVASDWLVRLGYVGTKATHLRADYDQNAPIYDFSRSLQENQQTINQRRPRQDYQGIYTLFTGLNQIYNSLQASVNKRFSRGISVLASYTWSRNIDYNSRNNNVQDNFIVNPFDFFYTRGPADNNFPHRFVGSFVWQLPDPGRSAHSRAMSAVFGGWQASGIVTLQSGRPFNVLSTGDRTAGAASGGPGGSSDSYADLIGPLSLGSDRSRGAQIAQYFNTSAVQQGAPGTFGNLGRNVLAGPAYKNLDVSMSKSFPLPVREGMRFIFRAEFFNALNRPQLSIPENHIGRATFGRISTVDADNRILQFSLKMEF